MKKMFRVLLTLASISLYLMGGASLGFAQCGPDGKQPCNTTTKKTPPKKTLPRPKPIIPVKPKHHPASPQGNTGAKEGNADSTKDGTNPSPNNTESTGNNSDAAAVKGETEQNKNTSAPNVAGSKVTRAAPAFDPAKRERARPLTERCTKDYENSDSDAAIKDCTRAIEIDPTNYLAYYHRGWANANNPSGSFEKALKDYAKAIDNNPRYGEAFSESGKIYLEKLEFDSAIDDFTNAIECKNLEPDRFAKVYHMRGNAYYAKADYDTAIGDYTSAIKYDSKYAKAYVDRAEAYFNKTEWVGAIDSFTKAIAIEPGNSGAKVRLDAANKKKDEYDAAIHKYSEAISTNPSASGYYSRGQVYLENNKYDEAIRDFTNAIGQSPQSIDALHAYTDRGLAHYKKKEVDEAISDYAEALKLDPNYVKALNNRGAAYYYKKENFRKMNWD